MIACPKTNKAAQQVFNYSVNHQLRDFIITKCPGAIANTLQGEEVHDVQDECST
jgi:hypothetical protein